jgi:hypothetical protein
MVGDKANKTASPHWLRRVLWDALTLNTDFYDDAHADPRAVRAAQIIVGLAALSHGLGSGMILLIYQPSVLGWIAGFLISGLSVVAGYYLWTYTIWQIDRKINPPVPPYRDLLAPVGFAYTPQILNFLTVVPLFGTPITLVLASWSLLAAIVAVRYGLNIPLWKAMIMAGIGFTLVQVGIGLIQRLTQVWLGAAGWSG